MEKKNHFIMAYAGNKRKECNQIYERIKDNIDDIKTIIEPFCGTSSFSFYMSLKFPKRFKYILNDINKDLIELYEIMMDEEKLNILIDRLNNLPQPMTKEMYLGIIKDGAFGWIVKNLIYSIRPGLYPSERNIKTNFDNLRNCPMINFLKTEDVIITNANGVDLLMVEQDNPDSLIFIDPPYLASCNSYYDLNKNTRLESTIYEYLADHNIKNMSSYIILVLESNWIIKLLFKDLVKGEYDKKYEGSKKNTSHLIIDNKNI